MTFTITAPLARVPIGHVMIQGQSYDVPMDEEWLRFITVYLTRAATAAGTGTVTNAANLTADQVVVGDGADAVKTLAAGANGTVLTIVGGLPAYAAAAAGSGTVTHTVGALTNHALVIGSGVTADDEKTIAAMTDGQLVIGATGADPAPQTMSGDGTLSSLGVLSITANLILQTQVFGG